MTKGYLSLVLHAHLPFVRHPEHEDFLEERWLFEAITETYLPLIHMMNGWLHDKVPFKLTMSITPPLANMLADPLLQERYLHHLDSLIELSEKEIERTKKSDPAFYNLATMYWHIFTNSRKTYADRYQCNLITAFRELQDTGNLEIITCGATHGFLPLLQHHPNGIRGQLVTAVIDYQRHFHRPPKGIWLPECGYFKGLENYLAEVGLRYFIVDSHGLDFADPRPIRGVYAPVWTPTGVAAFARDTESSKQVWSAESGYPGDYRYREFYRDLGFDMPYDYIKDYIHPDKIRINTGIKYFRVSDKGDLSNRQIYNRDEALEIAAQHAANFMFNRERQVEWLADQQGRPPIILAPYDAELFGHWWFEGPEWINFLVRKIAFDQNLFELTTPRHYLEMYPDQQIAQPASSSWGDKGYYEVWLNGSNDWIYPHLHKMAERMHALTHRGDLHEQLVLRAVKQAARELLLAQSSDWAFIMTTATSVDYANQRTVTHIQRFNELYEQIKDRRINEQFLADLESKDNIFPELDIEAWKE